MSGSAPRATVKAALTTVPRAARARSEPEKAKRGGAGASVSAPTTGSASAMAQRPVIRDGVAAGGEPLDLLRVVGAGGRVGALATSAGATPSPLKPLNTIGGIVTRT